MICATDREEVRNRWFEAIAGHSRIREVPSKETLLNLLKRDGKAFVLLHLSLPDLNGVAGVSGIAEQFPDAKLFCLADVPSDDEGLALLRCGVSGYANTYMNPGLLRQAVDIVEAGQVWLGKRLMQALISNAAKAVAPSPASVDVDPELMSKLTEREAQIAEVLAEGASNKVIARKLQITERTVKAHLTSIFEKTGTRDRLELALMIQGISHG